MARFITTDTLSIIGGANTSNLVNMQLNRIPLAVSVPNPMTSTSLTFETSNDNGATFVPIFYEGTQYSVAIVVGQARHVALDRRAFEGVRNVRVRTGSTEGAGRTLLLHSGE